MQQDRIAAIDILRALTMVLMIFVNDLWSLKGIPSWLEHVEFGVDGIGLADVVFPAFLFIVGLSIPYAIENRKKKGDSDKQLVIHVVLRTIALLVMGLFLVNGESINESVTGMQRHLWNSISCLCFILIWNAYPSRLNKKLVVVLKATAITTLLALAFIYRGGEDQNIQRFGIHWWGILGLIGWAYLAASLVTVFSRKNITLLLSVWIFFCVLSMLSHSKMIPSFLKFIPNAIMGGTLTGLTLGGVLAATAFNYLRSRQENKKLITIFLLASIVLIALSLITRPYWGLSKLGATPAWLFLCSAFTLLAFIFIYWLADMRGKARWFDITLPAGTDTLLCYLLPYFAYAATNMIGIHLPEFLLVGWVGLIKSFLFALLCAIVTGRLKRIGLQLKL